MAKLKDGFYKLTAEAVGSDLHVLLAGGGSKALSDFAMASAYLPLTGGTLTGPLAIKGSAANKPLLVRGIVGCDADASLVDDLHLLYQVNKKIKLGNDAGYYISEDGSYYSGKSANADKLDNIDSTEFLKRVSVPNNSENDFNLFSNMTLTGRGDPTTGASVKNAPWTGTGPDGGYGVLTYLWSNYGILMAWGYNSNRIRIRHRYWERDGGLTWRTSWDSLALTSDLKNPTDYYWADVKVSSTSNTSTSPTFAYPTSIYSKFTNGNEIIGYIGKGGSTDSLYFGNYKNADVSIFTDNKVSNCIHLKTGGLVGIGTISPVYRLDVNGTVGFGSSNKCDVFLRRSEGYSYINATSSLAFTVNGSSSNIAIGIATNKQATFYGDQVLSGLTTTCNKANDTDYMNSALQIREYNFGGALTDTWGIAPRLSWHWSGRVQTQIGLASSGDLKLSKDNFKTHHLLLHLGNSGVSGGGSSGGSSITVNIGNTSKTLTIPTSLPANGGNADTVDDYHASDFESDKCTIIDTRELDENTWYPVTFYIGAVRQTRIRVEGVTSTTWSWNTISDKQMAVLLDYVVLGSRWGWISPVRIVYNFALGSGAGGSNCVAGLGLLTNSSTEYVYVRGGAKYNFYISRFITPILRTESYTVQDQTVAPTTISPTPISRNNALKSDLTWSNITSKPNFATVATTGSYNDLNNKPTIPTVGNGTVTIKQSGTTIGSFTMNQSDNTTIELTDNNTDTKNTAGSTNTSSKIFLIGATSLATNPQTYSHDTAYVGTDGCLYSNSTKVSVDGHTHSYLPLSGGTISNTLYGPLTIERKDSDNMAAIKFKNSNGDLGSIGMNTVNGNLIIYNAAVSASRTILDSGNSSVSGNGGSTWGSYITVKINGTSKTLTIPSNPNTHWTTRIYAGASGTAANTAVTNPYLKVTDDNTYRNLVRFLGGGATTVSSDASGNITISSTNTNTNYYHTRVYSSGLKISTGTGVSDMYVPTGTTLTLGVVKQHTAADCTSYTSDEGATTPAAVKKAITTFVSIARNLTSGTKIGTITIGDTATDLYCQTNTNTDTKVTQTVTNSNATYPLLLAPSGQTATTTTTSYFDSGVTLNPSTNTITANITGSAGSVAWANVTEKPTIPTVTNYYWANINISASSNDATTPTFKSITMSNSGKYVTIYPLNSSYAHYTTNATIGHYFNTRVTINGHVDPYTDKAFTCGTDKTRWSNIYSVNGNFSGTVNLSGDVTWEDGKGESSCFPGHIYRNTYDGSNVYDHYYNSTTTGNSIANLRVKSGSTYKTLLFSGDGTFTWDGDEVIHSGNIADQSVNYANTAGYATSANNANNADKLSGYSISVTRTRPTSVESKQIIFVYE